MLFRRTLLLVGAGALVAGFALIALWLKSPPAGAQSRYDQRAVSVLAAARALPAGSLLRAGDLRWRRVSAERVVAGAFEQGRSSSASLLGAALRRALPAGGIVAADDVVHPDESGFLPAVLRPGMRAASISVGGSSGTSGLLTPGDHVDVILTQIFNDTGVAPSLRSVGETILHDLRVVAIDQRVNSIQNAKPEEPQLAGTKKPHLPKTVTVELTPRQAQVLAVATRLGQLELTLRSALTPAPGQWQPVAAPPPTWAAQASPALRRIEAELPNGRDARGHPTRPGSVVEIMRGGKVQERCFDAGTGAIADCGLVTPADKAGAEPKSTAGPSAPGPAIVRRPSAS